LGLTIGDFGMIGLISEFERNNQVNIFNKFLILLMSQFCDNLILFFSHDFRHIVIRVVRRRNSKELD